MLIDIHTHKPKLSENIEIGPCSRRIKRGDKVALLVGSRGIVDLHIIVKATIDSLVKLGAIPFIVPSMGSHGAGIAEEQKKIIEGYGIAVSVKVLFSIPLRICRDSLLLIKAIRNAPKAPIAAASVGVAAPV